MLQLHRVFCATPWELEGERRRFTELIGEFNETRALPHQVLFVPVSLINIGDKRPVQYVIDENIEACRHYLLVLTDSWGPEQRNFRKDYLLALQCQADPKLPMAEVCVLHKRFPSEPALPEGFPTPDGEFSTMDQFVEQLTAFLERSLAALTAK